MKNKKVLIIVSVIVGIIVLSIGIGALAIRHLARTAIEKQEEIANEIKDNNTSKIKIDDIVDIGEPAPDFTLEDLEGNTVSLKDFQGEKVVFLNFWASWCPPCREEMPDLDKLHQENSGDDFIVLAINIGESEKVVKGFIEENGYSFPVLLDKTQKTGIAYNTFSIPTSVLVDKEGKVRAYRVGPMTYKQMVEELENIQ